MGSESTISTFSHRRNSDTLFSQGREGATVWRKSLATPTVRAWIGLLAFFWSFICSFEELRAGSYVNLGLRSAQFAAKPLEDEPTPNYYAFGPKIAFGYSFRQILDMGLYVTGLPGSRGNASANGYDASLVNGGAELALRIAKSIYLGVYGGKSDYRLVRASKSLEPGVEWAGRHRGFGGGISLGALVPFSKESFVLVALDFEEHHFSQSEPDKNQKRVLECFGVTVAYSFNNYKNFLIDNTIFKDFLDSMYF